MKSRELSRQVQALKLLITRTREASVGEIEIQSHWARYLCVLVAGFLENALAELFSDLGHRTASPRVASFTSSALKRTQNPRASKFIEITSAFDKLWARELKDYLDDDGRKQAVDSIMANRHLIVHGKNSGITIARIDSYFQKSLDVVEFLEKRLS